MPDTLSAFARRCSGFESIADVQMFAGTRAVTIDLTGEVRKSIKAAAPGGVVRGSRGKPVRIGAGYRLNANRTGFVFARGPLQLVERDTKRHGEPKSLAAAGTARRARQQRAGFRNRKTLKIPGIGFRRRVNHPGTKGKHPFQNAVDSYSASGKASSIYRRYVNKALREVAR